MVGGENQDLLHKGNFPVTRLGQQSYRISPAFKY